MKKSPLQLKWVSYPALSYEFLDDREWVDAPIAVDIIPEVRWDKDGDHMISVTVNSKDDGAASYKFNAIAIAGFSFDLDGAIAAYRPSSNVQLPSLIGVNVARVVFSGVREHIAMVTARGPTGAVFIESLIIEPSDLKIVSNEQPSTILREVFKATEEDVARIEARVAEKKVAKKTNKGRREKKTP